MSYSNYSRESCAKLERILVSLCNAAWLPMTSRHVTDTASVAARACMLSYSTHAGEAVVTAKDGSTLAMQSPRSDCRQHAMSVNTSSLHVAAAAESVLYLFPHPSHISAQSHSAPVTPVPAFRPRLGTSRYLAAADNNAVGGRWDCLSPRFPHFSTVTWNSYDSYSQPILRQVPKCKLCSQDSQDEGSHSFTENHIRCEKQKWAQKCFACSLRYRSTRCGLRSKKKISHIYFRTPLLSLQCFPDTLIGYVYIPRPQTPTPIDAYCVSTFRPLILTINLHHSL